MTKNIIETSKYLSFLLRHQPESIGLVLDNQGWADINELIQLSAKAGRVLSRELLQQVVEASDKKRFTLSEDSLRIRAAQGHSNAQVSINYQPTTPPDILYHGTATRFVESIMQQGLIPGSRHHVHLSEQLSTARDVGSRYGKPHILVVNSKQMAQDGFEFYLSENHVWLTDKVPANYLEDYS